MPVRFSRPRTTRARVGYHIEGSYWGGEEWWAKRAVQGPAACLALFPVLPTSAPNDAPTPAHRRESHLFRPADPRAGRRTGHARRVMSRPGLQPSVLCPARPPEATSRAGDVYPGPTPSIVHTADPGRTAAREWWPSPGVAVPGGFPLDGSDPSPVARAIVRGLGGGRRR